MKLGQRKPQCKSLSERFSDKWVPEPYSGCWLWTGHIGKYGYGILCEWLNEKTVMRRAHRVAWRLYCGEIPVGLNVLHKCDVRCCVNPRHLFLGTNLDNGRDCRAKGRTLRGDRSPFSKLTSSQVTEIKTAIRDKTAMKTALAERYGVAAGTIGSIAYGRTWTHVLI